MFMYKLKSVSLIALLAFNGQASTGLEKKDVLLNACNRKDYEVIKQVLNKDAVTNERESNLYIDSDAEVICRFLEENLDLIEQEDSTINKNNGITTGF